jgi:tetratricopeptide (TPR) repeat protein
VGFLPQPSQVRFTAALMNCRFRGDFWEATMLSRWLAPALFFLLIANCAHAQMGGVGGGYGNVHIRAVLPNGRPGPARLLVRLMDGSSNAPVATNYTDDMGTANFLGISPGYYHVVVSGDGIESSDSGQFEIDTRKMTQDQMVYIQPIANANSGQTPPGSSMISVAELNIPSNARKEFEKASEAMSHQDWKKALQRLNQAISISPTYASAYNNLGVVYSHMSDWLHEREALQKAISLNDHFGEAMVNLAKLCLRDNDYVQAQNLLERATSFDPNNGQDLLLLANAQLMNKHYGEAIASAGKVHSLAHDHSPLAHYIAARAYEHENRPQDALSELDVFLKEEPQGQRADHVRDEVQSIHRQMQ